jgi:hypothetical protein
MLALLGGYSARETGNNVLFLPEMAQSTKHFGFTFLNV